MLADWRRDLIRQIAERLYLREHLFVIGRGPSYPLALEAALKVKEVSYVHAEGFAGGELKHGVIALVEPGTAIVNAAPAQLLGYYLALLRGCDPDKPRNLAKSVTVK